MSSTIRKVIGNLKNIMKTYFYDKSETDALLDGKVSSSDMTSALSVKANASDVTTALAGKSDNTHTHDGRYPLTDTFTSEVGRLDGRINGLVGFRVEIVNGGLSSITDAEEGVMYILRNSETSGSNLYDEYIYVNGQFERIGDTAVEVDLSDYATTSFVNTSLSNYVSVNTYNTGMNGKANTTHTHSISDVTNLQSTLNSKAGTSVATSSANGLMSSTDKAKLDALSEVMVAIQLADNTTVTYGIGED